MPTIPTPDARTLADWQAKGLIPPLTQRLGDDLGPKRAKAGRGKKVAQTRSNATTGASTPVQSESEFQAQVVQLAKIHGWTVIHHPDSRRATGAGWVDLVLGHEQRGVVFAELKRDGEKPRPSQVWWHERLRAAGCRVYVWTPSGWGEVVAVLNGTTQQGA